MHGERVLIYNGINNVPLRSRFAARSNHVSIALLVVWRVDLDGRPTLPFVLVELAD